MNENDLFELIKNHKWLDFIKNVDETHDLNVQDKYSNYMIQYVVTMDNIDVLNKLLSHEVIVDWIDNDGKTILYNPIKYNFDNIIKILLDYDKNNIGVFLLNNIDNNGEYPIHYAIKFKNYTIYKDLLNKSNTFFLDKFGNTLLHLCIKTKNTNIISETIKKVDINALNFNNETSLHIAATYDLNDIILLLIENNIDLNIKEKNYGFTALSICILQDNIIGAEIIIKHKPDINIQDNNGNSIVHLSILEYNEPILKQLLDISFNFNLINLDGNTCLHLLIEKFMQGIKINDEILKIFISNTILNIQNNMGDTLWHYIIKSKIFKLYEDIFKQTNNNIFIKNNDGLTPYDYSKKFSQELKNLLLDIICTSYYNNIINKNIEWAEEWENKCSKNKKQCLENIKKVIINEQRSLPYKKTNYVISIDEPIHVPYTSFIGINFDVIMSYIYLMKTNPNIFTSITENFITNDQVSNYYKNIGIIKDLKDEFLNFEIYWIFQQLIFPTNLDNTIKTFFTLSKTIMAIPLAFELNIGAHANIIIIDKVNKVVERFEPNGKNEPFGFNYNHILLDNLLEKYFLKHIPEYKYITPLNTQNEIGFQLYEINETCKYGKICDPGGFCIVWCIWYATQREKFINIKPEKLTNKIIINIRSKNISFKKLIRMFSVEIIKIRNSILEQLELDINDIKNNNLTEKQKTDIQQLIKLELLGFI